MKELRRLHSDTKPAYQPPAKKAHVGITEVHAAKFIDSTGIPLTSDREMPEVVKNIDFDYRPNSFRTSPSRYPNGAPHEIPVSGLEQKRLGESYRDMMQTISMVRDGYAGTLPYKKDKTKPLSAHEFLVVLDIFKFLPNYLTHRAEKPLKPNGELPPVVMVLSNSASGTKGALGAWMDIHESEAGYMEKTPDIDEMIELIEGLGTMVKKTACAASPAQQRHFMDAVLSGPSDKSMSSGGLSFLTREEIPNLVKFGSAMNKGSGFLAEIIRLDAVADQMVRGIRDASALVPGREQETVEAIKGISQRFLGQTRPLIVALDAVESQMNTALGREASARNSFSLKDINARKSLKMYPEVVALKSGNQAQAQARHARENVDRRRRMFLR